MHPVIFRIGPLTIYSYGVMLSLAFLTAVSLMAARSKKAGLNPDIILDLSVCLLISGIIGGRLLHVGLNLGYYTAYPREIIMLHHGGLAYQGGVVLAGLCGFWYLKKKKISFLKTADFVVPYVALGQFLGRIGCFLNGCCYGRETDCALGVLFPGREAYVHPTQLYYSASWLAVFVVLNILSSRKRFRGKIFALYFLFYGFIRFFIDFLRGDLPGVLFGLTATQLINLSFVLLAGVLYLYQATYGKKEI
ncbi:MAG: prolipoprotein diacylglyceryl transferase [Candidatus Omnitrophica bacterium]|nr:prolipoprotein diacylglyceryl transferase [Candidatus Omnitrophota bacterium]